MTVLTVDEITNLFLYGSESKPSDLTDENLVSRSAASITVNPNLYMEEVWSSIVTPSQFDVVNKFLSGDNPNDFSSGQSYDLDDALSVFGQSTDILNLRLVDYNDGSDEMRDQIYIWNSATFGLHDSITFSVAADGTRTIENYAPVPEEDNFDFVSGGELANLGNTLLLDNTE